MAVMGVSGEGSQDASAAGRDGPAAPGGPLADIERPLALFGRLLSTAAVLFLLAYAAGIVLVLTSGFLEGETRQVEFVALWSAARLALEGRAISAFDQDVLRQVQALPLDSYPGELLWLYPPGLQFLLLPLAWLPYWAAWLLFGLVSIVVFARSYWRTAAPVPMGRNLLVGAPAVVIVVQLGHIVLLWGAAFGAALRAMASGNPALAGTLFALLSLKPQLGLLVPVMLVAARRWDVVLWTILGAVLVHGLPTLVVGLEYWAAHLERMAAMARAIANDMQPHRLMVSPYAFGRYVGMSHEPALLLQILASLLAAAAVFAVWRNPRPGADLAGGIVLLAAPFATPYAFYYELALVVPAAILLVRGGFGAAAADRVLLALAVLAPVILIMPRPPAPLFALLLLALLARSVAFALRGSAGAAKNAGAR